MGVTEDELFQYMTRWRKIRSGSLKRAKREVIVQVVLYASFLWFSCHPQLDDFAAPAPVHDAEAQDLQQPTQGNGRISDRSCCAILTRRHPYQGRHVLVRVSACGTSNIPKSAERKSGCACAASSHGSSAVTSAPRAAPAAAASLVPTNHAPTDAAAAGWHRSARGSARRRSGQCRACGELKRQTLTRTDRQNWRCAGAEGYGHRSA